MESLIGKTLYRIDSKGKTRAWVVNVEDRITHATIVVSAGIDGGKMVDTRIPILEGKNIGKSNETTPLEQAANEAQSKAEAQLRQGYVLDKSKAKAATLGSGIAAPMLAQKYDPTMKQSSSKNLDKMKIRSKRIAVQPKYDGNRCLIFVNGGGVKMYTRKGDEMIPLTHILEEIHDRYLDLDLKGGIVLDGELFSEEISFSTLNGLLRKQDKTRK